jgi:hypothetical protein
VKEEIRAGQLLRPWRQFPQKQTRFYHHLGHEAAPLALGVTFPFTIACSKFSSSLIGFSRVEPTEGRPFVPLSFDDPIPLGWLVE